MAGAPHQEQPTPVRSRRARWGVPSRLLVLVLVPVLGVLVLAASTVRTQLQASAHADEMVEHVDHVARLVAVRAALFHERVPAEGIVALRQLGLPLEEAGQLLESDPDRQLREAQAATDRAIADLGPATLPALGDGLAKARAVVTNPSTNTGPLIDSFVPLERELDRAILHHVANARSRGLMVPGVDAVGDSLDGTRGAIELLGAAINQSVALYHMFLGTGDVAIPMRNFISYEAERRVAARNLDAVDVPEVATAWAAVRDGKLARTYDRYVSRVVTGDAPRLRAGAAEVERVKTDSKNLLDYEKSLFTLLDATTDAARHAVAGVRLNAANDLRASLLLPVPVIVITLAICLVFARSISRPMRRLADHAAAVGAGDLAVEPLRRSGPRELSVAFDAFNDLVANLRLIDAKSQALADLDLESPVLAQPLPGRLGRSLEASLSALSGSLDERDRLRHRLLQQASQDGLTGVHNRAAATEALAQALGRARRSDEGVAVLHIDLDDFKRVNDSHGHGAGDAVLRESARRLVLTAGEGAFVARLGGDEFLVMVEDVRDAGEINELARRLRDALGRPIETGSTVATLGASIGIAFAWQGDEGASQVLAWADQAVHRAKQRAAGSIEISDESLQEQLRELAEIEEALHAAMPRDELFLQYQPVIDLATGRMSSVEALVRWQRPGVGMQPPDTFIPVAERSDLIVALDNWVMARAARQLQEWAGREELSGLQVAINVSGRHLLSQTLYDHVVDLLDRTGIAPQRLVVEITETVLVNDLVVAAAQLEAVRGLGVRIALDDFGTGYTSITHLRQLPIDIIKIDRSFIQRLVGEKDRTLLAMITELGHNLGFTITAEGVETAEQYQLLQELGCDRAQGYHMSRPLPPEALEAWAHEQATGSAVR